MSNNELPITTLSVVLAQKEVELIDCVPTFTLGMIPPDFTFDEFVSSWIKDNKVKVIVLDGENL